MKVVVAVILGGAALATTGVYGSTRGHTVTPRSPRSSRPALTKGVVDEVRASRSHTTAVSVRVASTQVSRVLTVFPQRVSSADGRTLSSASVRPGDKVTIFSPSRLQDESQRTVNLVGVVSLAPESAHDSMILQSGSGGVIVDLSSSTALREGDSGPDTFDELQESQQVRVRGILDAALGEVTQTDSVARLAQ